MRIHWQYEFTVSKICLVSAVALTVFTIGVQASSQAPLSETIACRVLESHTDAQLRVSAVIFHQRDQSDRGRLGSFLRAHSGEAVQFQSADGKWHDATVVRLKSCFGRGVLLFPAGAAQLAEKDEFDLRFSSAPAPSR